MFLLTNAVGCGIILVRTTSTTKYQSSSERRSYATDEPRDHQIDIHYKIRKLRYKYKQSDDRKHTAILNNILWYSYGVVYGSDEYDKHANAVNARKAQKRRYNAKLRDMVESYDELYFVTLTFTDEVLSSTSEETQHRYARRWLTDNCRDYLANEDFGKKNGRRHYHAVIAKKEAVEPWKYGFYKIKPIREPQDVDRYRLSSYMLKLTNHAGKLGTGKHFSKRGWKEVDKLPF